MFESTMSCSDMFLQSNNLCNDIDTWNSDVFIEIHVIVTWQNMAPRVHSPLMTEVRVKGPLPMAVSKLHQARFSTSLLGVVRSPFLVRINQQTVPLPPIVASIMLDKTIIPSILSNSAAHSLLLCPMFVLLGVTFMAILAISCVTMAAVIVVSQCRNIALNSVTFFIVYYHWIYLSTQCILCMYFDKCPCPVSNIITVCLQFYPPDPISV